MHASACITHLNAGVKSFIASIPPSRVVSGPNHGPHVMVDVKQITARSLGPSLVVQAPGIAGVLVTGHVAVECAVISMSWMYMSVCVCIIVDMHVSALYTSVA